MTPVRHRLQVTGVVQGVGFRPFVHRIAREAGLVGFVRNDTGHVHIEVQGPARAIERFEHRLRVEPPPLARVDDVAATEVDQGDDTAFTIAPSAVAGAAPPNMAADVGVCEDCRSELFDPTDRRYRHPFITCTNCGPRFTIITAMPYDRANTTMRDFELCAACATEYHDPADRRHHAQPLACPACGPTLRHETEAATTLGTDLVIQQVQTDLAAGRIVAIKGLGGYHLAVDATDTHAVARLRARKDRGDKPFAVMVADTAAARRLAEVSDAERAVLESGANPIVLLRARRSALAGQVAPGSPLLGIMLPSTPLHHLLFAPVPDHDSPVPSALVMTSGNLREEPICIDDREARERLGGLADSFCAHDRPIHTPCDDSVVRVVDGEPVPIRRSRGFAPLPLALPHDVDPTLAVGGEIKNTFAVGRGRVAWMSQHLGDMGNRETLDAFESSVELLTRVHDSAPEVIAADAHPGYHTHRWADSRPGTAEVVTVQHHHAHLAALMAEHGLPGDAPVIGFVFDGTGHGADRESWGGEVLVGDYGTFERAGHLRGVVLPGGDSAARNPCRTALAHLHAAGVVWSADLAPVRATDDVERRVLAGQLRSERLSTRSTSMGRLFDAMASLLDLRHRITYEAQAAIELEFLATDADDLVPLRFALEPAGEFDSAPLVRDAVAARRAGADPGAIARGFHYAVADLVVESAGRIRDAAGHEVAGLTGGVFQNVLLAQLSRDRLLAAGFEVLTHRLVPPNDGGLALGQLMVANRRRKGPTCA